ncbi:hypothetical protein B0O80DRAFT_424672 [Mortierella sp. GBAus27b]|nr:hypothetical protein B0O80DRAFT_424672 [Mortierella sp. GBAus27b]
MAIEMRHKKSEKWRGRAQPAQPNNPTPQTSATEPPSDSSPQSQFKRGTDVATVPQTVFPRNLRHPAIEFKPPEPDSRLNNTPQLVFCLGLLQTFQDPNDILDPVAQTWLQFVKDDSDEQDRLKILATGVIKAFKRDEFKDPKAVIEVVCLAPVLEGDDFRYLLKEFFSGIEQSTLLDMHQLESLAQLMESADPGQLDADDLVKILELLSSRLRDTHQQSTNNIYRLTLAVSHVLDAMTDAGVTGLGRKNLHDPLSAYLTSLEKSPDTYLVYQAAYTFQALQCVPDNESLWKATLRRTGKVIKGVSTLVSAVKGLDLNAFIDGLGDIQQGLSGALKVAKFVKDTYDDVKSLAEDVADSLLQELRQNGDAKKQALYQACQEKGPGSHPLKIVLPAPGHPSLLDRVQEKPDVEGHLRQLRRQRLKERGTTVYIPPQAKSQFTGT